MWLSCFYHIITIGSIFIRQGGKRRESYEIATVFVILARQRNMDIWSKEKRSEVMSHIRSRDTKPELIVRKYLWARGYRYRKNVVGLPGTPDIVLRSYGVAIFIHGCFWHGHTTHMRQPQSNVEFWSKKIRRNQARDRENKAKLKALGWRVMTVWECQLKPATRKATLQEIEYWISKSFINRVSYSDEIKNDELIAAESNITYDKKK